MSDALSSDFKPPLPGGLFYGDLGCFIFQLNPFIQPFLGDLQHEYPRIFEIFEIYLEARVKGKKAQEEFPLNLMR